MSTPSKKVFLVADREEEALYVRRAIAESRSLLLVHRAKNAKETVSYLLGAGVYAKREWFPLPHVLILDLEMAKGDGFEILEWLKNSSLAHSVRTVALAANEHPPFFERATNLGARCCLTKPYRGGALIEFTRKLEEWCNAAPPADSLN